MKRRFSSSTQMMGRDIGVGHGPMGGQADLMDQAFGPALITQHLVGKPRSSGQIRKRISTCRSRA